MNDDIAKAIAGLDPMEIQALVLLTFRPNDIAICEVAIVMGLSHRRARSVMESARSKLDDAGVGEALFQARRKRFQREREDESAYQKRIAALREAIKS